MVETIELGEINAEVIRKDIKNVHLSVYPPDGKVKISAPARMKLDAIRAFALSKLDWIKTQRRKMREQERETPRDFVNRESHYVWGKRYLLKVVEHDAPPRVELDHGTMLLHVRPGTDTARKREIVAEWYRSEIRGALPTLIEKWEALLGVKVERFFIQGMRTKWGSCNHSAGSIRLNTELAKKPRECLEYVLVHEMIHLIEPTHGPRFIELISGAMPKWKLYRDNLNRLPVRHEKWDY
jgi:hypothetical protein